MKGLVDKKDVKPKVITKPVKDSLKARRYKERGEYYAKRVAAKGRSTEEIFDSVFPPVKAPLPTLTRKPTEHFPSGDNCCLPKVAIFSGVKAKQPKDEFGITVRA
ncbi:hypothetical protein AYY18_19870 [Morganella psychrotolerans]|uniref:Uncharacterized protein n=2 Tax=Morganella psychrotolerans TaxID=368603 RepID=A0A1B8HC72_9GAMM|nr:hypothetical protein AYY18_19870 [Morganella psychrotolerans]